MKLACAVHRFGPTIAGGSERHCRLVAEHLAESHDVTVLTSCAQEPVTWQNAFPAGRSDLGRVHVLRFPVARPRRLHRFAEISETVFAGRSTPAEQESWFRENGPEMPALLDHLRQHGREYDFILFFSYRYYQSFFGVPLVADRAVLVPTAEEDPLVRVDVLDRFFSLPAGYLFNTPEEADLIASRCSQPLPPSIVVGCGIGPPVAPPPVDLAALGMTRPFLLYVGRIEPNKGCVTLLRYFDQYLERGGRPVPLVMAGPANMPLPAHPLIKPLGVVDDALRDTLLSEACALVMPSPFESLSMVVQEAWNRGVPVLVNGHCRVLKGQVLRADGGLYYHRAGEFAAGLTFLLDHPDAARQLGRQGFAYVEREYRWPTVVRKVETFLGERLAQRPAG